MLTHAIRVRDSVEKLLDEHAGKFEEIDGQRIMCLVWQKSVQRSAPSIRSHLKSSNTNNQHVGILNENTEPVNFISKSVTRDVLDPFNVQRMKYQLKHKIDFHLIAIQNYLGSQTVSGALINWTPDDLSCVSNVSHANDEMNRFFQLLRPCIVQTDEASASRIYARKF